MVGDALVIRQKIIQHKAVLDRADTGLQTRDVAGLDLAHQTVHDLLQRLDLARGVGVALLERIHRAVDDVLHGGLQNRQIVERFLAELDVLVADFLGCFNNVHGVVGDALKVADGVQQRVDGAVVIH